ncbi:MAG: phosphatase PAP2 family protein [Helicobacteraceae bacterium]|jgi:lipid A 4'-phosphatase|nr:phosphatase PAP2 family protein [Helicobacteraceae bacterium]
MFFGVSLRFLAFAAPIALFLISFSGVDIWISSFFYEDGVWRLKNDPFLLFLYDYAPIGTAFFALCCLALGSAAFLCRAKAKSSDKARFLYARRYLPLFLVLSYALGPGLVVNTIFKDNFGRARPAQIEEFGGDKRFTPPFVIANECEKNCSFSSGHATVGFYFVSLALILSGGAAKAVFAFSVFYGALIGFARIAQGGHFFSDVAFSFLFVYLTAKILYHLMFVRLKLGRGTI